jgi:hypothetical protein
VLEETGLTVVVGELLGSARIGHYLVDDFAATVTSGELSAGDDASDARWCSREELDALPTSPGLLDALRGMGAL